MEARRLHNGWNAVATLKMKKRLTTVALIVATLVAYYYKVVEGTRIEGLALK